MCRSKARGNSHIGSESLLEQISTGQPRYHLFGHVHESHGIETKRWKKNSTHFYNGALADTDTRCGQGQSGPAMSIGQH